MDTRVVFRFLGPQTANVNKTGRNCQTPGVYLESNEPHHFQARKQSVFLSSEPISSNENNGKASSESSKYDSSIRFPSGMTSL